MQGGMGGGGGGHSRGNSGWGGSEGTADREGKGGREGRGQGGSGGTAAGEAAGRRSSQVVGVSWNSSKGKWQAGVTVECTRVFLGYHTTEEAAARAIAKYVEDGVDPVKRLDRTSQIKGVSWDKKRGKWKAGCKGAYLGHHATEEAAAQAYNRYIEDGVVTVRIRDRTSQFKGVCWNKPCGKWQAQCKGKSLGYHATEEAAAQAYNKYVEDGVAPVKRPSRPKGVSWHQGRGKWQAKCKGTWLGYHATEEAAARAYNIEARRVGITTLNDIPPAGNTDTGNSGDNKGVGIIMGSGAAAFSQRAASERAAAGGGGAASAPVATATTGLGADDAGGRATTNDAGQKRKTPPRKLEAGADPNGQIFQSPRAVLTNHSGP